MKSDLGEVAQTQEVRINTKIPSNTDVLKVTLPHTLRSKRNVFFLRITDTVREKLAAGLPVTELEIQPLCRGYPGDSRKALKKVHQCYPTSTRLVIDNGIYRIEPVTP